MNDDQIDSLKRMQEAQERYKKAQKEYLEAKRHLHHQVKSVRARMPWLEVLSDGEFEDD